MTDAAPTPPTDAELILRLRRMSQAVYLATDEPVARDLSDGLKLAADRIEAGRASVTEPKPDPEVEHADDCRTLGHAGLICWDRGDGRGECCADPEVARLSRELAKSQAGHRLANANSKRRGEERDRLSAVIAEIRQWGEDADLGDNYNSPTVEAFWRILAAASADQPAIREDEEPFVDPEPWRSVFPKPGGLNAYYRFPDAVNTGMKVTHKPRTRAKYEADQEAGR